MAQDLSKTPAYKLLQPGDPYVFLNVTEEQLAVAYELHDAGKPTAQWFDTAEPGRLFKITRIHDKQRCIETTYIGFQKEPGSTEAVPS